MIFTFSITLSRLSIELTVLFFFRNHAVHFGSIIYSYTAQQSALTETLRFLHGNSSCLLVLYQLIFVDTIHDSSTSEIYIAIQDCDTYLLSYDTVISFWGTWLRKYFYFEFIKYLMNSRLVICLFWWLQIQLCIIQYATANGIGWNIYIWHMKSTKRITTSRKGGIVKMIVT